MEELTICPECGEKSVYHNRGITKQGVHAGQPWENYKCSKCAYIKWVNLNKEAAKEMGMPPELKPSAKLSDFFIKVEQIGEEAKRIREKLK